MTVDVSVLIPQYGRTDLTVRAVDAVRRSSGDLVVDVHVHDNASAAGVGPIASRDDVHLTTSDENLGFGPAVDAMARDAAGTFLLILNNDTIVHPGAIDRLVRTARTIDPCGPVVPLYRDFEGRSLEMGGGLGEGGKAWQLWRHRDLPRGLAQTPHRADYGSAAAMLIDRELYLGVDGFDDAYAPAYYEDTDLCLRLAADGRPTIVEPRALVVHFEGGTAGTDTSTGLKAHQVRNRSTFVGRWGEHLSSHGRVGLQRSVTAATTPAPGKPRILYVSNVLPRGDRDGGGRRAMEMLSAVRGEGAGVALHARTPQDPERYGPRLAALGIPWFGAGGPARWSGAGHPAARYDDLEELLGAAPWDVVVVWTARMARSVTPIVREHAPHAAVVIDNGDVHFLRHERGRALGVDIVDPLTKDQELDAYADADGVITSSEPEDVVLRDEIERLPTHVFTVAPPEPVVLQPALDGAVMFLGNFGHPPNTDAISNWSLDVEPRLTERLGRRVPLRVVGAGTDGLPHGDALDIVGWVPELADEFARTRVFLAPLRYGAGTKGKLVEAMAHGVPVVTTPTGAEGFPTRVVDAMLVATDGDGLAAHVATLLDDDEAWTEQRRLVVEAAAWFHERSVGAGAALAAWMLGRTYAHRNGLRRPRRREPESGESQALAADVGGPTTDRPFDPRALPAVVTTTPQPVFVVGAPRSGTSMMAHSLGSHPELWTGEESDFLAPLGRRAQEAWRFGRRRRDLHWLSGEGVSWDEFAAYLGIGMNALYTARSGGQRWVEQTPQYTLSLPLMAKMFPGARFVFMLRDGRSVVHSLAHFVNPVEHERASQLWARFVRAGLEFAESELGDQLLVVDYAAVVRDTADELGRIFDFLGLDQAEASVGFIADRGPINSSFSGETSRGKTEARWASWSREMRETFHSAAGDLLVQLGYEADSSWITRDLG